ncbi:hypothetical protein EYZ11_011769 [Aspergillus tanneri]|uniref:Uncharacterized protein n=1 Tax=Aspergillus tanneri TaxID=1220188 RepID=A0A4S3J1Z1_9EURO|nr:hypothetical protein EYZ11_011769 [Aspergillus tanneri]
MCGVGNELNGTLWCKRDYLYGREDRTTYIAELIVASGQRYLAITLLSAPNTRTLQALGAEPVQPIR